MAKQFHTPINLNYNEARSFVFESLASDPSSKPDGHTYYNTTDHTVRIKRNGVYGPLEVNPAEQMGMKVDNGSVVVPVGLVRYSRIPFNCNITGWTIAAADTGSIVFDIWSAAVTTSPEADVTVANTITASAKPTLSSGAFVTSTTLTGWTTALVGGRYIAYKIDSASAITKVTLTLHVTR